VSGGARSPVVEVTVPFGYHRRTPVRILRPRRVGRTFPPAPVIVMRRLVVVLLAALCLPALAGAVPPSAGAQPPACYTPAQAAAHVGERACVEGTVTSATFAQRSTGQPTFLDFGTEFTAVIWIEDRPKFNPPPETLRGRRVRVQGQITTFRGKAQIVVRDPAQLALVDTPAAAARAASPAPAATDAARATPTTADPTAPPGAVAAPETATPQPLARAATPAPAGAPDARAARTAATAAPAHDASTVRGGGASPWLIAAGVALVVLGGAGAGLYALRRR
jgi:hypothetical protein